MSPASALTEPALALALTLAVYVAAERLHARLRSPLLHPVLVSVAVLAPLLSALQVDYARYAEATRAASFWLGPSVVALGVTLADQAEAISRRARSLLVSLLLGSAVGVLSAAGLARALGAPREVVATLAPKSVTTPIAMVVAERLGGLPALTAVLVILVGVFGAVVGPGLLRLLGVRSRFAWGLAMGASAHAVGTARALEQGEEEGAASALAIGLNGLLTSLLAPELMRLLWPP